MKRARDGLEEGDAEFSVLVSPTFFVSASRAFSRPDLRLPQPRYELTAHANILAGSSQEFLFSYRRR